MLFGLAALLLSIECIAEHDSAASVRDEVRTLKQWQKLMQFEGISLKSDSAEPFDFGFIFSNEGHHALFESHVPAGKVLTGVGAMRMFDLASGTKPSHLVLFDYNKGVYLFNLILAQLVEVSRNRFELLSYLLTGRLMSNEIALARNGKIDLVEFVNRLAGPLRGSYQRHKENPFLVNPFTEIVLRWKDMGIELPGDRDWDSVISKGLGFQLFDMFPLVVQQMKKAGTLTQSMMGTDERFQTIKELAHKQKITVMHADLIGTQALRSLTAAMQSKKSVLGAIDLSNVPEHLSSQIPRAAINAALENIRAFPKDTETRVLFTGDGAGGSAWSYYVTTFEKFSQIQQLYPDTALINFSLKGVRGLFNPLPQQ